MRSRIIAWAFGLSIVAAPAFAGEKVPLASESVFFGTGFIVGSPSYARATPNTVESIGCFVAAEQYPGFPDPYYSVICSGTNSAGVRRYCYVYDTALLAEQARAIQSDDYVDIRYNPSTGTCTGISVRRSSAYAPKMP